MLVESECYKRKCKHFIGIENPTSGKGDDFDESKERYVCKAFPNGIPVEIMLGKNLHLKPYDGDHGIQYEREK